MSHQTALNVLILEDRPADAELMAHELQPRRLRSAVATGRDRSGLSVAPYPPPDVILADYTMPEMDAARALQLLQERGLRIPFIVVSGTIGEDVAVAMMRARRRRLLLKDRSRTPGARGPDGSDREQTAPGEEPDRKGTASQ